MSRYVPLSHREEEIEPEKKKRRTSQQVAIERSYQRNEILEQFCKKYEIYKDDEICKHIRKIFNSAKTRNVPLSDYKLQLEQIGQAIPIVGKDSLTLKISSNAIRGYMRLIYDNQITDKRKKTAKDNIVDLKSDSNTRTAKLSDFESYRDYLENETDEELRKFVKENFNIDV